MRYSRAVLPTRDDWSTRHSVLATARRTAALVNALMPESPDPHDIARVLRAHGESEPLGVSAADVAGMRHAALRIKEVFAAADADAAAAALNRLLGEHTGRLRLTSHNGASPWHPHLDESDDAPWAQWFLASSCLALTVVVWDRQRPPGGLCESRTCPNVHLDLGSGPARRYCSKRCATRERVAAHRRAHSVPST